MHRAHGNFGITTIAFLVCVKQLRILTSWQQQLKSGNPQNTRAFGVNTKPRTVLELDIEQENLNLKAWNNTILIMRSD